MKRLTAIAAAAAGLLLNTWAFAAAEAQTPASETTREVRFSYSASATPDAIYARLRVTADRACRTDGRRPLAILKSDEACADKLLSAAVARVGRADVAAIHQAEPIKLAGS